MLFLPLVLKYPHDGMDDNKDNNNNDHYRSKKYVGTIMSLHSGANVACHLKATPQTDLNYSTLPTHDKRRSKESDCPLPH